MENLMIVMPMALIPSCFILMFIIFNFKYSRCVYDRLYTRAGVQYHIGVNEEEIGSYVFLTGDPGRVEEVAKYLQDAHLYKEIGNMSLIQAF